jgi:quercetin dioxygenase-like cupin family protein
MKDPNSPTHELRPDERLDSARMGETRDQLIVVSEGVVYVALEDDDRVLTPGDQTLIRAGEPRCVWNAGDETARFVIVDVVVSRPNNRTLRRAA